MVLGLNWLTRYNPLVDWVLRSIDFRTPVQESVPPTTSLRACLPLEASPAPIYGSPAVPLSPPDSTPVSPVLTPVSPAPVAPESTAPRPPSISLINAAAFARASKLPGSQVFQINLTDPEASARAAAATDPTPVDLKNIPQEYHEFADVFSKGRADSLPPHRPYDLKINLEDGATPPFGPIYSLSQSELTALREFIDEHLSIGFIRPTRSPCGAPVLFIKKKDGSLRLCVDFRGLNRITKKDRYPIPLTADLLDAPRKARIYTKIDLRHAYHLVRIAEGDEWKTAFRTRYGSFEWNVMPFGLTNAPATFQRFMNDIFSDLLDLSVVIYLDDILIYSDNMADHKKQVREVLRRLRANGLYARADKCEFHSDSVEYLGFILSPEGLTMDPAKVSAIQNWPEPRKVRDVQSFLGFANFYRRFIHDYSKIVLPLTRLTRKGTPWEFSSKCKEAFEKLKIAFTTAPILAHWSPEAPIIVETDASDYAIAAILSQTQADGEIHPIAFLSHSLTPAELNYDTHDKELLAIYRAFETWYRYLCYEYSAFSLRSNSMSKKLYYSCLSFQSDVNLQLKPISFS